MKIANFGLSYDKTSEDYCCIRSHKATPVPLRWLAPETIRHNKLSVYSDIWSYGVLLWEIFSFGARPYADLSDPEVVKNVLDSYILPPPEKCPQGVYTLMEQCWNMVPSKRPWFHTIRTKLATMATPTAGGGGGGGERKSYGSGVGNVTTTTPEMARALRTR